MLGALTACVDSARPVEPAVTPRLARDAENARLTTFRSQQRDVMERVAKSLARTLAQPSHRRDLLAQLRASRHTTEHKLSVQRFLEDNGGRWQQRLLARGGPDNRAVIQAARQVGGWELYLPLSRDRARYVGDTTLLVAAAVEEGQPVTAYTLSGDSVVLSNTVPPDRPVLVITPSETNFAVELPQHLAVNVVATEGAVGTWRRRASTKGGQGAAQYLSDADATPLIEEDPCDANPYAPGCPPPPPPPPAPTTKGVYLRQSNIFNIGQYEEYLRGNPEIVYRVSRPTFPSLSGNPVPGPSINCALQFVTNTQPNYWDQDTDFQRASLSTPMGLLVSDAQVTAAEQIYSNGLGDFPVEVWEDDSGQGCAYDTPFDEGEEKLKGTAQLGKALWDLGGSAWKCVNPADLTAISIGNSAKRFNPATLKACVLWRGIQAAWGAVQVVFGGNDDFIGTVYAIGSLPGPSAPVGERNFFAFANPSSAPWANYVIVQRAGEDNQSIRGYLRIEHLDSYSSFFCSVVDLTGCW